MRRVFRPSTKNCGAKNKKPSSGMPMTPIDDAVVEAVARALNLNFKAQFDGRPIPDTGLYDPTDWTATGKELDLTEMAGAAIHAYRQAMRERGVVECPREATEKMVLAGKRVPLKLTEDEEPQIYRAMLSAIEKGE